MRVDKFLKVSRLIKRRTIAKDMSEKGRITLNGVVAKPSTVVKVGDEIRVKFGQKMITVRVDRIQETTKKQEAAGMYTLLMEKFASDVSS